MISAFFLVLIISTALLFGNEFTIGHFLHPLMARVNHRAFMPAIQLMARFFGSVMPFWMIGTLLAHLLLLWLSWQWPSRPTGFLLGATLLWIVIIVFSVTGPVPINNRVKEWDISRLPDDWEEQRRRWDSLNTIRVYLIGAAFVALLLSYRSFPVPTVPFPR